MKKSIVVFCMLFPIVSVADINILVLEQYDLGAFVTSNGTTTTGGSFSINPQTGVVSSPVNIKNFISPSVGDFKISGVVSETTDFPVLVELNTLTLNSYIAVIPKLYIKSESSGVSCTKLLEDALGSKWCCSSSQTGNATFSVGGNVVLQSGFSPGAYNSSLSISAVKSEVTCP